LTDVCHICENLANGIHIHLSANTDFVIDIDACLKLAAKVVRSLNSHCL